MICERCQRNEAQVHVRQRVDGVDSEHHFCETCATQLAQAQMLSGLSTVAAGLFGSAQLSIPSFGAQGAAASSACPRCGTSLREVLRHSRLGCPACYDAFRTALDQVLRRVQGCTRYVGRAPERPETDAGPAEPAAVEAPADWRQLFDDAGALDEGRFSALAGAAQAAFVDWLTVEQGEAVRIEDYERAARCRDDLRRCRALMGVAAGEEGTA